MSKAKRPNDQVPERYPAYIELLWRLGCVLWWVLSRLRVVFIRPSKLEWVCVDAQVQTVSLSGDDLDQSVHVSGFEGHMRAQTVYHRHGLA